MGGHAYTAITIGGRATSASRGWIRVGHAIRRTLMVASLCVGHESVRTLTGRTELFYLVVVASAAPRGQSDSTSIA